MSGEFYVVRVNTEGSKRAPQVGNMFGPMSFEEGIDKVVDLVHEEVGGDRGTIREEVEADGDYAAEDGMFSIAVCQTEDS